MKRLTDKFWRNQDPWELCALGKTCQGSCVDDEGNVCDVAVMLMRLARYEDIGSVEDFENAADELCKRQWISVKDRLPTGSDGKSLCQMVIAYTVDKKLAVGWLNGYTWYLILEEKDEIDAFVRNYVTHWQPLPEPPKEG